MKILIADDEPVSRRMLQRLLTNARAVMAAEQGGNN